MLKSALDYNKFLAELVQNNINEAKTGYSLNFVGKDYAKLKYGLATETVLKPDTEHNSKPENKDSENVFITGDNLDALKHLQNAYQGEIKMIYIDPPYNTGKEFVYNDKFEFNDEQLRNALNYTDEEVSRLKSLQGKSSHSAWLSFMYPRLKIAQKLLSEDGIILVSIDDNEQANLKLLMDEIFGESNFWATITWDATNKAMNAGDAKYKIQDCIEYILVYGKEPMQDHAPLNLYSKGEKEYPFSNARGEYRLEEIQQRKNIGIKRSEKMVFTILETLPKDGYRWTIGEDTARQLEKNYDVELKNGKPIRKIYKEDEFNERFFPLWNDFSETCGTSEAGKTQLSELVKDHGFETVKPLELMRKLLFHFSNPKDEGYIIDFFAGSGTTAHAVTQLNSEDGGNRKFIMVQLDEPTKEGSEARNAGYNSIDEIARERVKRAGAGFKHYRCQAPPAQTIDKIEKFDPSKEIQGDLFGEMANAFGEETILQTWLISDGYEFSQIPETKNFAGYRAYYIDGSLYIINQGWGKEQTKELLNLVGKNELRLNHIRIYGYSLGMESLRELKINVSQSLSNVEIELRY